MHFQAPDRPLVLIIGGTGSIGNVIISALLEQDTFRVASLTRPASASRPAVKRLKSKGVEIRLGDFANDSMEHLTGVLAGVDILISSVSSEEVLEQGAVLEAAKNADVKRVIPCDFGPASPPGIRALYDEKLTIRSFVRDLGVPYTFIDVGWFMGFSLPHPQGSPAGWVADISHEFFGLGNVKNAVTDPSDVGALVVRIIEDPRTINQYVFCWGEHVNLQEAYEIADRISGQKLSDLKVHMPDDEIHRRSREAHTEYQQIPTPLAHAKWSYYEYAYSIFCRGDNTLEKAKANGALDAKALYPDFSPRTLEEFAKEFYETVVPNH